MYIYTHVYICIYTHTRRMAESKVQESEHLKIETEQNFRLKIDTLRTSFDLEHRQHVDRLTHIESEILFHPSTPSTPPPVSTPPSSSPSVHAHTYAHIHTHLRTPIHAHTYKHMLQHTHGHSDSLTPI